MLVVAANSAAADLVTASVDSARRTPLTAHGVAWATSANDRGEVADDLRLSHLTVALKRPEPQQRAFEEFLQQQQDPGSPNFHHWLTPVEVGERFGASMHDIDALTSWLQSQGLQVDAVSNSRSRVNFSGSAANVGAAFSSRLHTYAVNGEERIAPAGVPQVPVALSTLVESVRGLATINERPYHRAQRQEAAVGPAMTSASGKHFVYPADFAAIYDVNPVYQQGIDGTGQTIAIIGRARVYLPDIENFQSRSGLPLKDPAIIVPPGGIEPGPASSTGGGSFDDQSEATLDVTRAGSVAPGAMIQLVVSANAPTVSGLVIATLYVIDTNLARIMSFSFGGCESNFGSSGVRYWDSVFSEAAAQGISVFVSSGDSGVAGCDPGFSTPPASQIASPSAVCASSRVTCVGGTQFADRANPDAYWSSINGAGFKSALGYIPEGAWNEPIDFGGGTQAAASGGGVSAYIAKPSWQTGPGVPGTQGRYTPDVSFSASGHDGYFACSAASGASCAADTNYQFTVYAGTSASTPSMAGIAALLNQKMGAPQGALNPRLYALAAIPGNGVFHDVTVSTSAASGCDISIPSECNNSTPGPSGLSGGLAGYLVGPGYDLATGLGSIDVANLLAQWNASAPPTNYQGLWWAAPAASENGWGINFAQQGSTIFGTWFTYDTTGKGWWLTLITNGSPSPGFYTADLFATTGPPFNAVPFVKPPGNVPSIGTAVLAFSNVSSGSFHYDVNLPGGKVSQTKTITQQQLAAPPLATCSTQANLAAATNYQDIWWAGTSATPGTEPGWGINFTHQGDVIFASWFTYDLDGTPLWLVATATKTSPGVYKGDLYRPSGPRFDAYDKNQWHPNTSVGTLTLTFADGNNATFDYTVQLTGFAPVSQSKTITRQVFVPPGTVCQ